MLSTYKILSKYRKGNPDLLQCKDKIVEIKEDITLVDFSNCSYVTKFGKYAAIENLTMTGNLEKIKELDLNPDFVHEKFDDSKYEEKIQEILKELKDNHEETIQLKWYEKTPLITSCVICGVIILTKG